MTKHNNRRQAWKEFQKDFGQNMQKETNAFQLIVDKEEDLAGLHL